MRLALILLMAASLLCQAPPSGDLDPRLIRGELRWFQLTETREEVAKRIVLPKMVADFGGDYQSWQYQLGEVEDHDSFTHALVFRKSTNTLVSVSRSFDPERNVDGFLPEDQTRVYAYHGVQPAFPVRVRRLPGEALLMSMGCAKPGQPTGQLVLMRESELKYFYPWLEEQLTAQASGPAQR